MPRIDHVVETVVSRSPRARQVEALFDVPPQERAVIRWMGNVPIEENDWHVGLIVGPSGCGKTTLARHLFGDAFHPELVWSSPSVIDDIDRSIGIQAVTEAFGSVGFNTIPAWLRPHSVLSTGEKFRVDVARRLLELPDPIVVDEFTSVVDRQVAQIGSHAIAKHVRKLGRKFVAVSCHYDIVDWLQPDWVLEPASMDFRWRSVQRRPPVDVQISRVPYDMWRLFAPYHYLTADLNRSARCFAAFVGGVPASFIGVLHFPHAKAKNIKRVSRMVTLPDYQGMGLIFALTDTVASAYKALGYRVRPTPAHPAFVRSFDRSPRWRLDKRPGSFGPRQGASSSEPGMYLSRPSATFEYVGEAMDKAQARVFVG